MRIRSIKTIASTAIDTIENIDIETVKKFGNPYVFGEISRLCNIETNPQLALERIVKISAIALTLGKMAGEE